MKKIIQKKCDICNYSEFRDADQMSLLFFDVCPQCRTGKLQKIGEMFVNVPAKQK